MRIVFNIILLLIVGFLIYALYSSIREPIAFQAERVKREEAVVAKLRKVRTAQEAYRNITGEFASDFDTLTQVLTNGNFKVIRVIGDPDDPDYTGKISYDTILQPVYDSMVNVLNMRNFDSLRYVPYTNGEVFDIDADVIEYQSTEVPVVEVGIQRKAFMGPWGDPRFARYDANYDPNMPLKFGNLGAPNLSGNWEN